MKALLSEMKGPASALKIRQIERPSPQAGEVLVAVNVAALNFFDTLIIEDKYQFKPERPFAPCAEFAGTVAEIGEGITGFAIGDRVCGSLKIGAACEYITVSGDELIAIPEGVSDEAAASIMITYGTSYHALKDRGDLKRGEILAVLGASGGVGQATIELGKLMGAKVIACASSQEKLDFCLKCGADYGINYQEENLRNALKAHGKDNASGGIDVIYDPVGGEYSDVAFRSLGYGGRLLVIGFATGEIPKIALNLPLLKSADLRGVFWGAFAQKFPKENAQNIADLMKWLQSEDIEPRIDSVFSLEEAEKGFDRLSQRKAMGKVLLKI